MSANLPPTSPHFIGLICALIGFLGLGLFLSRKGVKVRLGHMRRWIWVVAVPVLVLAGLLGNGVYGSVTIAFWLLSTMMFKTSYFISWASEKRIQHSGTNS